MAEHSPVGLPMRFTRTSDGVRIAYTVQGTGWPVIWTAQPPASNFCLLWKDRPEIPQPFADRFQFIMYDARGTGSSERECLDFSLDAMLADLDAVIRAADVSGVALVAAGQASMIALHYAARCPQLLSHLVFIDGFSTASDLKGRESFASALALGDDDWTALSDTFAALMLSPEARYVLSSVTPAAYRAVLAAYYEDDNWDATTALRNITTPALVIQTRDLPYAEKMASKLAAQMVTINDPSYVNLAPIVEAFLGRRATDGGTHTSSSSRGPLSARELEVLALIAAGRTNPEIAEALTITPATASKHVHNILEKLGLSRRSEAAAWWARNGGAND